MVGVRGRFSVVSLIFAPFAVLSSPPSLLVASFPTMIVAQFVAYVLFSIERNIRG